MKVLLIVFFPYAQTFCIDAFFYFGKRRIDYFELQKAIESKCVTNGNDKELVESMRKIIRGAKFERCIADSMENSTAKPPFLENTDFCSALQESQFRVCLKEFTIDISPCLSENEIYIQQLLLDAYDSGYEELCGINGVSNYRYLYDKANGTKDCLEMCGFLFFYYGSCTGNLNIFKQLERGVLNLNKQDICHDLESLQKCTTQVLEGVCNEEFSRFTDLVFHPLLEECNDLDARK